MNYKYVSQFDIIVFLVFTILGLFLGLLLMQSLSIILASFITLGVYVVLLHTQVKVVQFDLKTIDVWKVFVKKHYSIDQLEKVTYYPNINLYTRPILTFYLLNGDKLEIIEYRAELVYNLFKLIEDSDYQISVEIAKR